MNDNEMSKVIRAVVVSHYGECERVGANLHWCRRHDGDSRIEEGMSVCNVFVDWMELAEDAVKTMEPIIRAEYAEDEWELEVARKQGKREAAEQIAQALLTELVTYSIVSSNEPWDHPSIRVHGETEIRRAAADIARTFKKE
jgi:hypothetical protein